ncbi:hypothetical protein NLX78_04215 [Paenibacillus sp. Lou8.1]|nr:hypothetical protein [Paenibacillus sp. Lou8.1]MCP3806430.1 hypothetical protein [Paenibacillus sp. Lou8.1]
MASNAYDNSASLRLMEYRNMVVPQSGISTKERLHDPHATRQAVSGFLLTDYSTPQRLPFLRFRFGLCTRNFCI